MYIVFVSLIFKTWKTCTIGFCLFLNFCLFKDMKVSLFKDIKGCGAAAANTMQHLDRVSRSHRMSADDICKHWSCDEYMVINNCIHSEKLTNYVRFGPSMLVRILYIRQTTANISD